MQPSDMQRAVLTRGRERGFGNPIAGEEGLERVRADSEFPTLSHIIEHVPERPHTRPHQEKARSTAGILHS
ncbi:hypothetical protein MESS4_330023 [Mesorhizobium sp. STM 4661]|nr:hypothetical protein MESS4_330023 [Mesorhizobium sp. STM 4661]